MFIDKLLSLAIGLLFLLVLSCDGPAADSEKKAPIEQRTLSQDPVFWDYAASSNMLQAEIGQLAIERGEPATIKKIAEKAVSFHSTALTKLKTLASQQSGVHLPDSLTGADSQLVRDFEQLEGEEFNDRYRAFIVSTHRLQLERYQEALLKTEDIKTREWLTDMLLHLREEIQQFERVDSLDQDSSSVL